MDNIKEFQRSDRVRVDNCYEWDIAFHSDIARRDILIPGGSKGYALITVDMAEEEILKQNGFFVGLDGLGDHSGLRICDPEMYKFLFRCEDHTHHVSKEAIVEWLKLSTKAKYRDAIEENIKTNSEARMYLYYMNDIEWSDYLGWKHDILEGHCRHLMMH
jgi:hypothetical protein